MLISFTGNPYKTPKAIVYPISKDFSSTLISYVSRQATDKNYIAEGCNGKVFHLGQDLVVKKSKPDAVFSKDVMTEAEKLDLMENFRKETGFLLGNTQKGVGAFKFNNGESYLVSTFVKGKNPDFLTNPFNKQNFASLIDILTALDIGSSKTGRLLAYDFNLGNINISRNEAGLLDLEYIRPNQLEDQIKRQILAGNITFHSSDTSAIESNLRSFEFTGFYDYLQTLPKKEAKKLFEYYLHLKANYHSKMENFFKEYSKDSMYSEIALDIAKKENIHSKLLSKKNIPPDIIESEARKIQAVNFQFATWRHNINLHFNPNQVKKYYQENLNYFRNQLAAAIDNNDYERIVYYTDALRNVEKWKPNKITTPEQLSRVTKDLTVILENLVV